MSDAIHSSVVVDASVWISAFITEDAHNAISRPWLDNWLRAKNGVRCPTLALIEVGGAIARRTGNDDSARETVEGMRRLPLVNFAPLDETLTAVATRIAIERHLRGADAVYLAHAWLLGIPLITWDSELLDRSKNLIDTRTPTPPT
jgi:predicted nucleic acid-binding protein